MEFYDLTRPIRPGPAGFPGDPDVRFAPARTHAVDGYQVTQLCMGSHSGTHLDAPRHFFADGASLDQFPVERLLGPGVVVDCRPPVVNASRATVPAVESQPETIGEAYVIDAADLAARMSTFSIPPRGFVLLWTEGALLAENAAQLIVDAGPVVVGTDAGSLDREPYPAHRLLLGAGILLAENLYGLHRLGPAPITCAFLPLAVVGTDGAPIRAVAWR